MQDLYKYKTKNKFLIYFLVFTLLFNLGYGLDECKGTMTQDDIPCQVFLSLNTSQTICSSITYQLFRNQNKSIYSVPMQQVNGFTCNSTFNQTIVGTYTFIYRLSDGTFDSGSIVVTEGNNMINLFYFVMAICLGLFVIGLWKEDQTLTSISGIGIFIMGVYIAINGYSTLNNMLTIAIATICWGVGGYIFYKSSLENLGQPTND